MPPTPISNGAARRLGSPSAPSPNAGGINIHRLNGPAQKGLQRLRTRHHQIIHFHVLGFSNTEIADQLGYSAGMVGHTLRSEIAQQKIAAMRHEASLETVDVLREFAELSPVALEVAEEILTSTGEKAADRLAAAKLILTGAGHTGQKNTLEVNVNHVTDAEIIEAKKISRRLNRHMEGDGIEDAQVVSVEVTQGEDEG